MVVFQIYSISKSSPWATLKWAIAAHLPKVNVLSCLATARALFRLLSFLPSAASQTHPEYSHYIQ